MNCDNKTLCNNIISLKCENSQCVCSGMKTWNGSSCGNLLFISSIQLLIIIIKKLEFGTMNAKCNSTNPCQSQNGLVCSTNGTCSCLNSLTTFWNGGNCRK
jgi:hypothetical protein